ncbi:MAG TPA: hypothetical protein VFX96_08710 [Pyrinomonadaceae bacterium]|nr:hypothetical protein [Pyrinomonadaceae bacterium]
MARNIQSPARLVVLALAAMLALPVFAFADQGRGRGRGKPTEVFVNGHDARDGRWDRDGRRGRRGRRDRDDRYNDDYYRRRRDNDRGRYGRNDGYYGNNGYYNQQLRQVALNNGYNEGVDEGRKDRERGDRFDYSDEGDFRSGSKGYNSRYGNKDTYRQYFREGFARGYRDGYQSGYYGRDDRYRRGSSVGDILGGIFGRP